MADSLHEIEGIVTPDTFELAVHRMKVPGGWIYWLQPVNGVPVGTFVPQPAEVCALQPAELGVCLSADDYLALMTAGVMTRDEVRAELGLAPDHGAPEMSAPVSLPEAAATTDAAAAPVIDVPPAAAEAVQPVSSPGSTA